MGFKQQRTLNKPQWWIIIPILSLKSILPCKRKGKGDRTGFLGIGRDKGYRRKEKNLIKKTRKIDKESNNQRIDSQKMCKLKLKNKGSDKDKDKKSQRIGKERNKLRSSNRKS